jgi:hypothetical protein
MEKNAAAPNENKLYLIKSVNLLIQTRIDRNQKIYSYYTKI